jgi:hypothetical protein
MDADEGRRKAVVATLWVEPGMLFPGSSSWMVYRGRDFVLGTKSPREAV